MHHNTISISIFTLQTKYDIEHRQTKELHRYNLIILPINVISWLIKTCLTVVKFNWSLKLKDVTCWYLLSSYKLLYSKLCHIHRQLLRRCLSNAFAYIYTFNHHLCLWCNVCQYNKNYRDLYAKCLRKYDKQVNPIYTLLLTRINPESFYGTKCVIYVLRLKIFDNLCKV